MRKFLLIVFMCSLLFDTAQAQERTISGKVMSSEDGSPLPGVNVIVKGTTNGTATDAEGQYTLSVPGTDNVLVFSFVGFATVEKVATATIIDVQMELDAKQLSEIIVTG